jgi:hypothetical protein
VLNTELPFWAKFALPDVKLCHEQTDIQSMMVCATIALDAVSEAYLGLMQEQYADAFCVGDQIGCHEISRHLAEAYYLLDQPALAHRWHQECQRTAPHQG